MWCGILWVLVGRVFFALVVFLVGFFPYSAVVFFACTHECLQDVPETRTFPQCSIQHEHPTRCSIKCWIWSFQPRLTGQEHRGLYSTPVHLLKEGTQQQPPSFTSNIYLLELKIHFAGLGFAAPPQHCPAKFKATCKRQIISFMFNPSHHPISNNPVPRVDAFLNTATHE